MARTGSRKGQQGRGGEDRWNPINQLAADQLAASNFKNKDIFTPGGKAGRVMDVFQKDGQYYVAVDFGRELGRHQVPIDRLAYERSRFVVSGSDDSEVRSMPSFTDDHAGYSNIAPDTALDIRGYQAGGVGAGEAAVYVQQAPPEVTVERPALAIHWEQAAAEVKVRQPTPQISVRQSEPSITVRQGAPTITVEWPEPEIVVQMAEPEVDVAMDEPQVQVDVPKPRVHVVQPDAPIVDIDSSEPLVSLAPREQAEIQVQRAQPKVSYERMGEPKVIVRENTGQPQIRVEESAPMSSASMSAGAEPVSLEKSDEALATEKGESLVERSVERGEQFAGKVSGKIDRIGEKVGEKLSESGRASAADVESRGDYGAYTREEALESVDITEAELLPAQIEGREVYDSLGEKVGTVHRVLVGPDGNVFMVLDRRGFLSLSHRLIMLPLESYTMSSDQSVFTLDRADAELQKLDDWDELSDAYAPISEDSRIRFPLASSK